VYQHQISPYLVSSSYSYEFIAQDFASTNIGDFLTNNIRNIKDITPSAINELSLCFEELISNAFIHGTFGLSCSYKELNGDQYNRFITQLLKNNSVADKKVFVNIVYRQATGILSITVTDQGNGFDYKSIKIDETNRFRGIGLINVLCDKVHYANGGRTVIIEKRIKKKNKPKVAASQS
jgi:anti-sigma regulatory factor (Ser/Thr protein kinase)